MYRVSGVQSGRQKSVSGRFRFCEEKVQRDLDSVPLPETFETLIAQSEIFDKNNEK